MQYFYAKWILHYLFSNESNPRINFQYFVLVQIYSAPLTNNDISPNSFTEHYLRQFFY